MSPNVLVPVAGGIQYKGPRKVPNYLTKSKMGAGGEGDAGRTLTGRMLSDPRVNPMAGEMPWVKQIPTYDIADQNAPCVEIQQMATMICPRVINANKDLKTESMRARSLPVNGNKPSLAWVQYDLDNRDTADKLLTNGSIFDQLGSAPAFPRPVGNMMISN